MKNIYDEAYKKYIEYCKEHWLNPYKKHTLTDKICRHTELRGKTPEEKVQYWYKLKLFKPDNPYLKYEKEKEFYDNYEDDKVGYSTYIKRLWEWYKKEKAIQHLRDNRYIKYYLANKNKAKVDYTVFVSRIRIGWNREKALGTNKILMSTKTKKYKNDLKKKGE